MKKTALALAILSLSSFAWAGSSVSVYGTLDASVESVKGAHTVSRVSSNNLNYSNIGFKGTEDLGSGLAAIFDLQSGVNVDTGSQAAASRFFNRESWVGLSGGAGTLRLGRTDSLIGKFAAEVVGAQPSDALSVIGSRAATTYRFIDNSVTYTAPGTGIPGMVVSLQYSNAAVGSSATTGAADPTQLGIESHGSSVGKTYGLSVAYAAGPLSAGLAYMNARDENSMVAGDQSANATLAYAAYDLSAAKVTAYYDAETTVPANNVVTGERRLNLIGIKAAVPVAPSLTIVGDLSRARHIPVGAAPATDFGDATLVSIKGIYDLSKRTAVYGLVTNVKASKNLGLIPTSNVSGLAAPNGGSSSHVLAVGIRHSF